MVRRNGTSRQPSARPPRWKDSSPNPRPSRVVFWNKTTKWGDSHIPARQKIFLTAEEFTTFPSRRPDGLSLGAKGKQCVFLEFTHPMDSVSSSDEGDWEEWKNMRRMRDTPCIATLSTILAPSQGDPGIAHRSTPRLEHTALLSRSNFKNHLSTWF